MGKVAHFPPTEAGLESTDATGVQTGNTDIPTPEWVPTDVQPGTTPLPGHEHSPNLPHLDRFMRGIVERFREDMRTEDRRCPSGFCSHDDLRLLPTLGWVSVLLLALFVAPELIQHVTSPEYAAQSTRRTGAAREPCRAAGVPRRRAGAHPEDDRRMPEARQARRREVMATAYDEWKADRSEQDRAEYLDELREQAIADLLDDPEWRKAHVAEADEWCDGTFSGEHYSAIERALADLSTVPADKLIGSDALATVLRLSEVHGAARDEQLRQIAERQADRDLEERRAA